jgi:phosphate transport system substrate-binding protein
VAEKFKSSQPGTAEVSVKFSGTSGGFREFCAGKTDISNASRPIQADEMSLCNRYGVRYIELPVAFDALTVVVNQENNWIDSITLEKLKKMWEPAAEGKITNWNQIRPEFPNKPLNLFGAGQDSGTFDYFTEAVVGKSGASRKDYVASEDDNTLVQGVSQDPNALGYFGLAYYEQNPQKLKALGIDSGKGAIVPSRETVVNSQYQPLARPLFIYVNAEKAQKSRALQEFVEYYLDNAESIVKEVGYIPLTVDILAAVKRTAIPKPHDLGFCFFPEGFFAPALTDSLCSGLMVALQTDTASPAAKIFLLALISRSWCVPQSGQSHSRIFNGIFSAIYPQLLHLLELGNHLSISM